MIISTAAGLGTGGLAFAVILLGFGRDLGRTALASGFYSGVYDLQGRALLDGSIAVPDGSMGIEGFVRGDQTFMYFPPFPAVLRLPVLMTTNEFDGRLTLVSMAIAYVVFAVMLTKLAWLALARVTESDEVTRTGATLVGIFLAAASGGTFLTYDAALPWVYHEVYLWAVASAVGALYWLTRVVIEPSWYAARWLGFFALVAVGTRATEGWALCLTVIGVALWMRFRPSTAGHRTAWWGVLTAGAVPLAASIALNVYKFGHPLLFPLQDQVWTQLNDHRQAALDANGGGLTGPQFFTTSFMAYLRPDGIRFVDYFPFITLPAEPAQAYNGAFVDQAYRTGSATAFMPLLMLLTIVTVLVLLGRWAPVGARAFRAPMLAGILITGGVMGYGYYATRYTTEFVPALVLGGAVGTALVVRLVGRWRPGRVPAVALAAVLTVFAVLAQLAIGTASLATAARGTTLRDYLAWQQRVSPDAQADLVGTVTGLPEGGRTDDLAIRGDCDAWYLNTGDAYEPWLTVQSRDVAVRVRADGTLRAGRMLLFEVPQTQQRVLLEVDDDEQLRVVLRDPDGEAGGAWVSLPPEGYLQVTLRNLTELGAWQVTGSAGGFVGYVSSTYIDDDWISHPTDLVDGTSDDAAERLGVRLEDVATLDLPLCRSLLERSGVAAGG
ncbi:hypothetical protein GCM10023340_34180 [Nocardioides marinquilinus]|uniref:Glycosyltransferase RgtA/B/C/D-like domain-containing protein n=1 Tax=Nocardioides marinquilinus TaxID=1210400 RepID=A0ABP9PWB0_9ACTN